MHHVYPSNVTDGGELPEVLERITGRLDRAGIPRPAVTLIIDQSADVLANTLALERSRLVWIASLPWDQAPPGLRQRGGRVSSSRRSAAECPRREDALSGVGPRAALRPAAFED